MLDDLCQLYRLFYKKCGGEDGVVGVRKDNQKFHTLAGKRRNKGFFRKRRIVPLFPTKNRKSRMQKVSRFGKKASHRENTTTDCSTCSTPTPSSPVHETDMDMSPFINLEAYRRPRPKAGYATRDTRFVSGMATHYTKPYFRYF